MANITDALPKFNLESRVFYFDYQFTAEVKGGDRIASVTVSGSPIGLTLSNPQPVSGGIATSVRIAGGTAGTTYTIISAAVTSGASTIIGRGLLYCGGVLASGV